MDRNQFNEALVSLVEYAGVNGNHVSTEDVKIYFKNFFTEDSQYTAVYDYLKANKIVIDDLNGYDTLLDEEDASSSQEVEDAKEESPFSHAPLESEEELAFIEMYENEISQYSDISETEKLSLIQAFLDGDETATEQITNAYLPIVKEIAEGYSGQIISLGDLIQEGNIGLLLAFTDFNGTALEFDSYVKSRIRASIDSAIGEQAHSNRIGDHLAGRMNTLDDLSRSLTEKLGRAPSVKELAQEMNISEEEVDTVIRTSLNVLTVAESKNNLTSNTNVPDSTIDSEQ